MLFKEVYMVVENPQEKDAGIEIISGEWEGLVYQYGDVQFVDGKIKKIYVYSREPEAAKE